MLAGSLTGEEICQNSQIVRNDISNKSYSNEKQLNVILSQSQTNAHPHAHTYLVCKAPHCWTSNENTLGSQGQRFQYITSCPDSSVQIDLDPALHRVHDLWQRVNLSATRVEDVARPAYCTVTAHVLVSVAVFPAVFSFCTAAQAWLCMLPQAKQQHSPVFWKRISKAVILTNCWVF